MPERSVTRERSVKKTAKYGANELERRAVICLSFGAGLGAMLAGGPNAIIVEIVGYGLAALVWAVWR